MNERETLINAYVDAKVAGLTFTWGTVEDENQAMIGIYVGTQKNGNNVTKPTRDELTGLLFAFPYNDNPIEEIYGWPDFTLEEVLWMYDNQRFLEKRL